VKIKVEGAAAKINAIFLFDKAAWRDIQRGVKRATDAITQDARSRVPPMGIVPMGGGRGYGPWNHGGRDLSYSRGAFGFSTRFQSRSKGGFREVRGRSLLDISEPSVAVFTLAGFHELSQTQERHTRRAAITLSAPQQADRYPSRRTKAKACGRACSRPPITRTARLLPRPSAS
jgi:hypothetical protein